MCRIAGFLDFNYNGSYDIDRVLESMRDTMTYGGPDDAGSFTDKSAGLALGHRRLSILDLSSLGHQPMATDDGQLLITYNGEVYNYKDIRRELETNGYRFKSDTDTEVLLKAYECWGIKAVHKFRGMWAFAIWDKKNRKLILCRDRAGVKPLYWYFKDGLFIFSSELKAFHQHPKFHKEIDPKALSLYLQYGYIVAPYCIFKHAYKLEPGRCLELDRNGQIEIKRYWNLRDYYLNGESEKEKWLKRSDNEVMGELEKILTESFQLRMVADVPVGVFLSGGIDSSLVTALLQKNNSQPLKTFTIGFSEKGYNEAVWAKKVAAHLGTDHTELYCTPKETFGIVSKLPELYDEPFGDSSAIPTYLLSKLAKQRVKVALSGDGGDEQFCGYTRYWIFDKSLRKIHQIPSYARKFVWHAMNKISADSAVKIYDSTKVFLPKISNVRDKYLKMRQILEGGDLFQKYFRLFSVFREEDISCLGLEEPYNIDMKSDLSPQLDDVSKLMLADFNTYLPDDLLTKVDRASMAVSLEGREPLLDQKILEYSSMLPMRFKYRENTSKYILRKILYQYVPESLIERPKQGFGIPVHLWFKHELKDLYTQYLNSDRIKKEGIFNHGYVKNLLNLYLNGEDVDPNKIWHLFSFQLWNERWGS